LKELVETGLLERQHSRIDRRSVHIKLYRRGGRCAILSSIVVEARPHAKQVGGVKADEFVTPRQVASSVERFWTAEVI
jgi:hypothetical protein